MRVVIKYARSGAANYISHLDMQRAFSRAIRRAGVAAAYSQGFNPHIVMSFASPLSVGYATLGDYLEVMMEEGAGTDGVQEKLNAALPEDIRVLDVFSTGENSKKLMSINHSAAWRIIFAVVNEGDCDKIKDTAQKIAASASYPATDRRGKTVDIAPMVLDVKTAQNMVEAVLKNANDGALNPAVLAEAILAGAGLAVPYEICRTECLGMIGGMPQPFTALKQKEKNL